MMTSSPSLDDEMRICIVTPIFPPETGGPSTYVPELCDRLMRKGHKCGVVTCGSSPPTKMDFDVYWIRATNPLTRHWRMVTTIRRYIKKGNAGLVYAQDPVVSGFPSMVASKLTGVPFVLKIVSDPSWEAARLTHRTELDLDRFQKHPKGGRTKLLRKLQIRVASNADAIITPSEYFKTIIMGWGIEENKITVIPNAVKSFKKMCKREVRTKLGLPLNRRIIATIGRLVPWKNVDKIIRAVQKIDGRSQLIIIGDGPERNALEELAKKLNIDVKFTGVVKHDEVFAYLQAADVFVLFSSYEGQSHVLLEAISCGCPVVASDIASNREVITPKRGYLVKLGDITALSRKIEIALKIKRRFYDKEFCWPRVVSQTLNVFERVVGARHG
jgi:glycosyltransferase involved in cell wall biosynthesis